MTLKQIPNSLSAPDGSQYVTLTDGAGNLVTAGGGTPAAPTTSIQFNNAGAFGGSANLVWNNGTNTLTSGVLTLVGTTNAAISATSGSVILGANSAQMVVGVSGNQINNFTGGHADNNYSFQTPTTGFTITLSNANWHTVLDPAGTLATGTITMPASPIDGQIVNVRSSQVVTTLTVSPNTGQSIKNAPTTIAAGGIIEGIFRSANTTWYF